MAEWQTHIPETIKRMPLRSFFNGQAQGADPSGTHTIHAISRQGEGGYSFKPSETKTDRLKDKHQGAFRVQFDGRSINEASLEDLEFIESAEFNYVLNEAAGLRSTVISSLEYAVEKQLLRVSFKSNGAVVTYGGIPISVFAQLKYTNDSGRSVGAKFWDLIRLHSRGSLPAPTAQADPESWADYYPKTSNFVRKGSKYQSLKSYDSTSRPVKYRPTMQQEAEAEQLTQEVITGKRGDKVLSNEELRDRMKIIKRLRDGSVSADMIARITASINAEATEAVRQNAVEELMGASQQLGAEVVSTVDVGSAAARRKVVDRDSGFRETSGTAGRETLTDILAKIEALDQNDPHYAANRAALFAQYERGQRRRSDPNYQGVY